MEKYLKMVFTSENIRLAVILIAIACSFVWLRSDFREEIAQVRQEVHELKINDLAHLNAAIEALTFTLMKNGTLTPEDKNYIDSRLKSLP